VETMLSKKMEPSPILLQELVLLRQLRSLLLRQVAASFHLP